MDLPAKKEVLPSGKTTLTEADRSVALEHCKKMIRDGALSFTWSVLNIGIACYNLRKFDLYRDMGYDSFESAITGEFGMSDRHGRRYASIGEQLANVLGGGYITQRMIEDAIQSEVYQSRLGFRKIYVLGQTAEGMQRLVSARQEEDLEEFLSPFRDAADELNAEAAEQPKTPLKAAMGKRFSDTNEASDSDVRMLFDATIRQINELTSKYVARLRSALESLPPEIAAQKKVNVRKAMNLWNTVRELQEGLAQIARIYPDAHDLQVMMGGVPVGRGFKEGPPVNLDDPKYADLRKELKL